MLTVVKKYIVLLILEVFCICISFINCFKEEKLIYSQYGNLLELNAQESLSFRSETLVLEPGVYQLQVYASIPQDNRLVINVSCGESNYKALRSNQVTMYAGQEYVDYEIYVLDEVRTAYIQEDFSVNTIEVSSVELYRTNLGERIIFLGVLIFFLLLNILLLYRECILNGKISIQNQIAVWGLFFGILLAYLPYMTDYMFLGADLGFHLLRIEGLKETLMQGNQFPVRIQDYWLYDHGYAVSLFYGDFFLFIPALLRIIGFSTMTSYKIFVFVIMSATAGVAFYSFRKCTGSTYAGLFGAIIYILSPYWIYNYYNRGAVGEYLAMTFLPLVICGMYQLYTLPIDSKEYKKAKIDLICGMTGILQSHILTCEITIVIIVFVCIVYWQRTFRKQTIVQLIQAAVISLLINCWFWFPMLHMMIADKYTFNGFIENTIQNKGILLAGIFQLFPKAGSAQTGMYMCEPIQLGIASMLLLILFLVLRIGKVAYKQEQCANPYKRVCSSFFIMIVITLFMSTRYFPWDMLTKIPVVGTLVTSIQFPTRLLSPCTALAAFFAGFFSLWLREESKTWERWRMRSETLVKGIVLGVLILAVGSAVYHVNDIVFVKDAKWIYTAENMGTVTVLGGEFLPIELNHNTDNIGNLPNAYHQPQAEGALLWENYEKIGDHISVRVLNNSSEELLLELPVLGYKGYMIESEAGEDELPYIYEERGGHGDLIIAIPPFYRGNISVWYRGFLSFRIAELISVITVIGMIMYQLYRRKKWKKSSDEHAIL